MHTYNNVQDCGVTHPYLERIHTGIVRNRAVPVLVNTRYALPVHGGQVLHVRVRLSISGKFTSPRTRILGRCPYNPTTTPFLDK